MKVKSIILLLFWLNLVQVFAQDSIVLTFEQFKEIVKSNHPVVKQANLIAEFGEAEIQKTKGALDPKFIFDFDGKDFKDKNYYEYSNVYLKMPTLLGLELKAGYEVNRGDFLSQESTTPSSGLWYAGVDFPLLQGLLFDERRAAIQQAKIFANLTKNEQELIINDILLEAYATYWDWYEAALKLKIAKEGVDFSKFRYSGVQRTVIAGDSPGIDTVEAKIQLDNRLMDFLKAQTHYINTLYAISNYIWTDKNEPTLLNENTQPQLNFSELKLQGLRPSNDSIIPSLPLLMKYKYKLDQLAIEEKWKKEQLKPIVNLRYIPLSQPVGNNPIANYSVNNYKYGMNVYFPIFLRKERASLQQTRIKIKQSNFDLQLKYNEIRVKERALINEIIQLQELVRIQTRQVEQAKTLRDAEQTKFELGESSLFLVNSREISYLTYKNKLAEAQAKIKQVEFKWAWLHSTLND